MPDGSCCDRRYVKDGRCMPPNTCPPGQIKTSDGQCCDRQYVRDGKCMPPNSCPPGQIKLPDGSCCDRRYVKDGKCVPPISCPRGQINTSDGCCPRENVHDGSCVVIRKEIHPPIIKEIHPPLHRLRIYEPHEPREPDHPVTRFHLHIPTGVIGKPQTTIPRGTISPRGGGAKFVR
jgi:hypothetical protein